jgi:hypothetical protein
MQETGMASRAVAKGRQNGFALQCRVSGVRSVFGARTAVFDPGASPIWAVDARSARALSACTRSARSRRRHLSARIADPATYKSAKEWKVSAPFAMSPSGPQPERLAGSVLRFLNRAQWTSRSNPRRPLTWQSLPSRVRSAKWCSFRRNGRCLRREVSPDPAPECSWFRSTNQRGLQRVSPRSSAMARPLGRLVGRRGRRAWTSSRGFVFLTRRDRRRNLGIYDLQYENGVLA